MSPVASQVIWNRLISIVEEQAQALIRTAFSTSVREAGDLSAGVYDTDGRMMAQAVTGTPGHVNSMAAAVAHFIRRIGLENIFPGDVYITNDPWEGTGHLHDITIVSPSFREDRLVGFFGSTAHIVDIGGRGFTAEANSIYEEGFHIPIMKFAERGEVDQTLIRLLRQNVREPDQAVGDIYALATCNEIGHRRLMDMMDEFAIDGLNEIAEYIFENSRNATLDKINTLPRQSAENLMTIDGYDTPIDLKVHLVIEEDKVICDFAGSSRVDKKGVNVPLVYTQAYACYALKCAIAPEVPNNAASLAPFEVSAPEGSILNAKHPAPVALRHVVGQMLPDAVYGALDQILPDTVPAEGASALCNFQVSVRPVAGEQGAVDARRAEVLTFNSGGTGARPTLDGMNATAFPSGVMAMPVEATEHTGPIVIWRKELREDSGGAGEYRGGLGQYMEIGAREGYEFEFFAMFDRVHHPARGRRGGKPGGATSLETSSGEKLSGKGKHSFSAGERVKLEFPGGGGYGEPDKRNADAIARDLAHSYITEETAKHEYGMTDEIITEIKTAIKNGEAPK
ncbi:MAG: hydantoinase B/oxoprolinase family protein [Marinicaulis sp.]|nr:hydantoinase B/oxoprolinase family protein [Marinicaulis sp.]